MRIIIVEDEPNTRDGLMGIIKRHTQHEIVYAAVNGKEGLEKIRQFKPDLVISDIKMPEMDGLSMFQKLYEEGEEFCSLLLTGYSEFEYARTALRLDVMEYILKPLDVEAFLETLKRVEHKIEKTMVEKISPSQLLFSYIFGTKEEKIRLLPRVEETLQVNKKIQSSLFLVKCGNIARESMTEMMEETKTVLSAMCMENYYLIFLSQDMGFLVLVADTERNKSLKRMFQIKVMEKISRISPCFCSYTTIFGLNQLEEEISHLKDMIRHSFSFKVGTVLDEELLQKYPYQSILYPDTIERAICRELRSGRKERIKELSRQFKEEIIESKGNPECIKEYTIQFTARVLKVGSELKENLKKENGVQYIMGNMAVSNSKEELSRDFDKVMDMLISDKEETFGETENGMILNVITYIRENYAKEVTLSETASMCGVTPEYLSKIFLREMNVNFVAFLQNFRISAAKRMLGSGKFKIGEVSEAVGFHDQKYFVKVFKKICGVTPSEYKKEMNNG